MASTALQCIKDSVLLDILPTTSTLLLYRNLFQKERFVLPKKAGTKLQTDKYTRKCSMHQSRNDNIKVPSIVVTLFLSTYFGHNIADKKDVKISVLFD